MATAAGPKTIREVVELVLVDRFQQHDHRLLEQFALGRRDSERSLLALPRLFDVGPSNCRGTIAPALSAVDQIGQPFIQVLFVLRYAHTVDAGGSALP